MPPKPTRESAGGLYSFDLLHQYTTGKSIVIVPPGWTVSIISAAQTSAENIQFPVYLLILSTGEMMVHVDISAAFSADSFFPGFIFW